MTQRVVLDTNILVANFNPSNSLRLLLDGARSAQIVVIVPELVIREASNKYREQLEAKLRELEKVASALRRFQFAVDVPPRDEARARAMRYERDLRRSLRDARAVIPELPAVSHAKLLQKALDRRKPFKDRDSGYRDALLWESVLEQADHGATVLCTMNSRDFAEPDRPSCLAADLLQEVLDANHDGATVTLSADLSGLVRTLVDVEAATSDEVRRALPEILSALEPHVVAALYDYDFESRRLGPAPDRGVADREPDFEVERADVIDAQIVAASNLAHVAVQEVLSFSEDALLVALSGQIDVDLDVELELDGHDLDGPRRVVRNGALTTTLEISFDGLFLRYDRAIVDVSITGAALLG